MQYRKIEEMRKVAAVHPSGGRAMSRAERLERWAAALEHRGGMVRALRGTEHVAGCQRQYLREDGSAISVAWADPVLRAEGLSGDTYGDAVTFFALRDDEAHFILCSCYAGERALAREVAARVRHAVIELRDMALGLGVVSLIASAAVIAAVL